MTEQENRAATDGVVYLAGCAVRQIVPDAQRIAALDLEHVFAAAKKHKVSAAVGMALESAGVKDARFIQAVATAQRRTALMDADRAAVLARLEAEGIWYMPLKGSILKDLYPRFGMREMVDNDILFDRSRREDVRGIMEALGFTTTSFGKMNDDDYVKPPVSHFEMHATLFLKYDYGTAYGYYENVKDRLLKVLGTEWGYRFSNEDFYVYMVAHENKHFAELGGTGIRSLLDTYVFLTHNTLNMEYVAAETAKLGIADFERLNRTLALRLFGDEPLGPEEEEMLSYMKSSGAFGTLENQIDNMIREKGRGDFFRYRLVLPLYRMKELYPILKKAPALYPFVCVYRLVSKFFTNNRKVVAEARAALNLRGSRGTKGARRENGRDVPGQRKPGNDRL